MKIFQILNGMCHWECSTCQTLEETGQRYAPDLFFIETPDYVRPGWGYDPDAEGDARFIQPPLPEPNTWAGADGSAYQWMYDMETGTFYIADAEGNALSGEALTAAMEAMRSV